MIDSVDLVFAETAPDLAAPDFAAGLRGVVTHAAWVRWSALVLGAFALGGTLALHVAIWAMRLLGEGGGRVTIAGHVFLALLAALGVVALLFAARLFRDVAPYRIDPATLASMGSRHKSDLIVRFA